jgi:hypothetical protein
MVQCGTVSGKSEVPPSRAAGRRIGLAAGADIRADVGNAAERLCASARAGMSETSRAAPSPAQRGDGNAARPDERQKDKLGDAFALVQRTGFPARVEEEYGDFSAVVRVDDADALGDGKALNRSEAAAGKNETGHVGSEGFNGNADGNRAAFSRGNDEGILPAEAGSEIEPDRPFRRRTQAVFTIDRRGVTKKKYIDDVLLRRKACHKCAPVK